MRQRIVITRKSSCVNARGIPTAAYQVLLGGVPPRPGLMGGGGGYPRWGTPWPGLMGVPKVGYPLARSEEGT